jgi:hypothetical protein
LAADPKSHRIGSSFCGRSVKRLGLVLRPCADVRSREVAHVVHVETKERAHRRLLEQIFRLLQAFAAQPIEIDPVLPIDRHGSVCFECHKNSFSYEHEL